MSKGVGDVLDSGLFLSAKKIKVGSVSQSNRATTSILTLYTLVRQWLTSIGQDSDVSSHAATFHLKVKSPTYQVDLVAFKCGCCTKYFVADDDNKASLLKEPKRRVF